MSRSSQRSRARWWKHQEQKQARQKSRLPRKSASHARRDDPLHRRSARRSPAPPRNRYREERRPDSVAMLSTYRPTYQDNGEPALRSLLSQIDYTKLDREPPRLADDGHQSRQAALADSLDYIDYLKGKRAQDSRKKSHYSVCKDLRYEVPEKYLVGMGARQELLLSRIWIPSPIFMALAAVEWIKELKERIEKAAEAETGHEGAGNGAGVAGVAVEGDSLVNASREGVSVKQESEELVENFFSRMQKWIGRWESGEIEGDDGWKTMEDCMDLSD